MGACSTRAAAQAGGQRHSGNRWEQERPIAVVEVADRARTCAAACIVEEIGDPASHVMSTRARVVPVELGEQGRPVLTGGGTIEEDVALTRAVAHGDDVEPCRHADELGHVRRVRETHELRKCRVEGCDVNAHPEVVSLGRQAAKRSTQSSSLGL